MIQPAEDMGAKGVRDAEADGESEQRDDEPHTQLAQVLDEGRLFTVAKPPRQQPHRLPGRVALAVGGG